MDTRDISRRWFWLGCGFEAMFLLAGVALLRFFPPTQPPTEQAGFSPMSDGWAAVAGMVAVGPMFCFFLWGVDTTFPPLAGLRDLLERRIRPVFGPWSLLQLAVIAVLAGVGEEVLFRGALQGGLAGWLGSGAALVVASALFGCCHWVSRTYALVAAMIGGYLGGLWLATGNLLAPIVAHGLYDFLALVAFLRFIPPKEPRADAARDLGMNE